jgi:hypothetical protein
MAEPHNRFDNFRATDSTWQIGVGLCRECIVSNGCLVKIVAPGIARARQDHRQCLTGGACILKRWRTVG